MLRPLLIAFCFAAAACSHSTPAPQAAQPASTPAPHVRLRLASPVWPPFTDGPDKPRVALSLVESALSRAGYDASMQVLPPAD